MKLAPDTTFVTRHVEVEAAAGGPLGSGGLLHVIGSRSDAARLATIIAVLRTRDVPQMIARYVGPGSLQGEAFDAAGVPRTETLIGEDAQTDVERTAHALTAAEQTLLERAPSMVVLGGDADPALAFALAASKMGIPIARVGAGLRCGDFSLSEEINRMLVDRLADVLFTDGREVADQLGYEGIDAAKVHHVGNTSVDLLRQCEPVAQRLAAWKRFGVERGRYVLATLHRPENVRDPWRVSQIVEALVSLVGRYPVVFPMHPATRARLELTGDLERMRDAGLHVTEPLGYLDFLSLQQAAGAILTDSGGVQDEASALGVRCYTLRRATERLMTLTHGTNVLLGDDPAEIGEVRLDAHLSIPTTIPLWDGRASERVAGRLEQSLTLELAG